VSLDRKNSLLYSKKIPSLENLKKNLSKRKSEALFRGGNVLSKNNQKTGFTGIN